MLCDPWPSRTGGDKQWSFFPFNSEEFQKFMNRNGIRHIRTSPHHPSSNGQAERAVQTFKTGVMKLKEGTLPTKAARFMFNYRTTPHTTTGHSPAEHMFGRKLRKHLDLLKPAVMFVHNRRGRRHTMMPTVRPENSLREQRFMRRTYLLVPSGCLGRSLRKEAPFHI